MVEPLRHRQTKGAETDMPGLPPPRHIPTLPRLCENSEIACKRRIWSEFLPSAEPVMAENGRIPAEIHKMPPGHSSFHTACTHSGLPIIVASSRSYKSAAEVLGRE